MCNMRFDCLYIYNMYVLYSPAQFQTVLVTHWTVQGPQAPYSGTHFRGISPIVYGRKSENRALGATRILLEPMK